MSAALQHPERDAEMQRLRAQGWTYATIAQHFGISSAKAWIICNRARQNANAAESHARWEARRRIALADLHE